MAKAKTKKAPQSVITEIEVLAYETAQLQLDQLAADLKHFAAIQAQRKTELIEKLKAGAVVLGEKKLAVIVKQNAACPKYKEELLTHMYEHHGIDPTLTLNEMHKRYPGKEREELMVIDPILKVM